MLLCFVLMHGHGYDLVFKVSGCHLPQMSLFTLAVQYASYTIELMNTYICNNNSSIYKHLVACNNNKNSFQVDIIDRERDPVNIRLLEAGRKQ